MLSELVRCMKSIIRLMTAIAGASSNGGMCINGVSAKLGAVSIHGLANLCKLIVQCQILRACWLCVCCGASLKPSKPSKPLEFWKFDKPLAIAALPFALQVIAAAPDVLILSPCSRSPAAAMADVQQLTWQPDFDDLPAVKTGRVYVIDHGFFSRPGPRLIDGIELLASLVYGDPLLQQTLQQQPAIDELDVPLGDSRASNSICCDNSAARLPAHGLGSSDINGTAIGVPDALVLQISRNCERHITWVPLL
eukprot:GHRR01029789.1.p1 GENE.GHRR01029789.1~~GHRR01029789.1.p1  ORF type:complete len:251 (+),score=79.23 GHRR01029789.1:186-938(+)